MQIRKNEILYELICQKCTTEKRLKIGKYRGETHRNAKTRSEEHIRDSKYDTEKSKQDSIIKRHSIYEHNSEPIEFKMKIMKSFQKDPLGRQVAEGIKIREMDEEEQINNKKEWTQPMEVIAIYRKHGQKDPENKMTKTKMDKKTETNKDINIIKNNSEAIDDKKEVEKTKSDTPTVESNENCI